MALAALGGLMVSLIRPNAIRSRALWAWLSVPFLLSVALGVVAALFGENLEPYSPVLFVPIFTIMFLPPWIIAACPVFAISRSLQAKIAERNHSVTLNQTDC